jgi:hypothetical protein
MFRLSDLLGSNLPMWLIAAVAGALVVRSGGSAFHRNRLQRQKDALEQIGLVIQREKLRREAIGLDLRVDPTLFANFDAASLSGGPSPKTLILTILVGLHLLLGSAVFATYVYDNTAIDWAFVKVSFVVSLAVLTLSCVVALAVDAKFKDVSLSAWTGLVGSVVALLFFVSLISIASSLGLFHLD